MFSDFKKVKNRCLRSQDRENHVKIEPNRAELRVKITLDEI